MAALKELIITFQANAKPVVDALQRVDKRLKHTDTRLQKTRMSLKKLGDTFSEVGRQLGLMIGLPLAAMGAASLKAEAQMESLRATLSSVLERYDTGLPIQQAVTKEITNLKNVTDELGVSLTNAIDPYVKYLAASKDSLQTNRKVIRAFLGMSSALGLNRIDVDRMIRALEQMQSKGVVMSEELKLQLGDIVPGAVKLFADAVGVSTKELFKMMKQGQVSSKILTKVADVINKKYGLAIKKGAETIRANANRISNAFYLLKVNVGSGLDEVFNVNKNMAKFADWLKKVAEDFARLNKRGKQLILWLTFGVGGIIVISAALGALIKILRLGGEAIYLLMIVPLRILSKVAWAVSGIIIKVLIRSIRLLIGVLIELAEALIPIIGLPALLAGLFVIAAYLIIKHWSSIKHLFVDIYNWVEKLIDKIKNTSIGGLVEDLKNKLKKALGIHVDATVKTKSQDNKDVSKTTTKKQDNVLSKIGGVIKGKTPESIYFNMTGFMKDLKNYHNGMKMSALKSINNSVVNNNNTSIMNDNKSSTKDNKKNIVNHNNITINVQSKDNNKEHIQSIQDAVEKALREHVKQQYSELATQ